MPVHKHFGSICNTHEQCCARRTDDVEDERAHNQSDTNSRDSADPVVDNEVARDAVDGCDDDSAHEKDSVDEDVVDDAGEDGAVHDHSPRLLRGFDVAASIDGDEGKCIGIEVFHHSFDALDAAQSEARANGVAVLAVRSSSHDFQSLQNRDDQRTDGEEVRFLRIF